MTSGRRWYGTCTGNPAHTLVPDGLEVPIDTMATFELAEQGFGHAAFVKNAVCAISGAS
jgi:hypothetical protein